MTNSSSSSFVCYGVDQDKLLIPKSTSLYRLQNEGKLGDLLEFGGPDPEYSTYVGLTPETIRAHFADRPIGDIPQIVADELNARFGTSFTAKDIGYFEEGWYDG